MAMSASAETPLPVDETSADREESGTIGLEGKSVLNSGSSSSNSEKPAPVLLSGEMLLASMTVTERASAPSPDPTSFSTRLADAPCRGDATVQGAHHRCDGNGGAGLRT